MQLVHSQNPCQQAIETLESSRECDISSVSSICMEVCVNLFNDVVRSCSQVSTFYSHSRDITISYVLQYSYGMHG